MSSTAHPLTAIDPDAGDTKTLTLFDDGGGKFAISGSNLIVAGSLDYETAQSHQVTVRVTDSGGEFYAEVMHESADGWRPVFEPEQMLKSRETWVYDAHWEELAQVRCPALVVRGLDGELGRAEAQEMVRVLPLGEYAEVADAGHLVNYDQPVAWRAAVEPFLDAVGVS